MIGGGVTTAALRGPNFFVCSFEFKLKPPSTEIPREKKKVILKKITTTPPKKSHEHSLLCWPADAPQKSGLSRREFPRLFSEAPGSPDIDACSSLGGA
jgi:hypothetical protein